MSWFSKVWSTFGDMDSQKSWQAEEGPEDEVEYAHFLERFGEAAYRPDGKLKRPEDFTDPLNAELAAQVWHSGERPKQAKGASRQDDSAAVAFSTPSSPEGRGGGFSMSPQETREEAEARCREEYERKVAAAERRRKVGRTGNATVYTLRGLADRLPKRGAGGQRQYTMPDPDIPKQALELDDYWKSEYEENLAQAVEEYRRGMQEAARLTANHGGGGGGGGAR